MAKLDTDKVLDLFSKRGLNAAQIAETFGVQSAAVCKVLRANGIVQRPDLATPRKEPIRRSHRTIPEPAEAQYVHRDPCPYCGVRGDLGCAHRKY